MEEQQHADHRPYRIRRRHKKRVYEPVRPKPRFLSLFVLGAILVALLIAWLIRQPARSPDSIHLLQQIIV